ncbi:MAG: hypothetical protein L6Q99_05615 [Planctomycetes bacterium]|nr:hypothetical protein [Planctomycetota bacterium]
MTNSPRFDCARDELLLVGVIAAAPLRQRTGWAGVCSVLAFVLGATLLGWGATEESSGVQTLSIITSCSSVSAIVVVVWAATYGRVLRRARGSWILAYAASAYAVHCGVTLAGCWAVVVACEAVGVGQGAPQLDALSGFVIAWRWGALAVLVTCWRRAPPTSIAWTLLLGWVIPTAVPFIGHEPARFAPFMASPNDHTFAPMVADIGAALAFSVAAILLERHPTTNA